MTGLRILVVDDEPQIQRFLRPSLQAAGYEVFEALNGADALKAAATIAAAGTGPAEGGAAPGPLILHATASHLPDAARTLIQDHIDHCLEDSVAALSKGDRSALDEFKQITRYL